LDWKIFQSWDFCIFRFNLSTYGFDNSQGNSFYTSNSFRECIKPTRIIAEKDIAAWE
jgi:hypothetical protein